LALPAWSGHHRDWDDHDKYKNIFLMDFGSGLGFGLLVMLVMLVMLGMLGMLAKWMDSGPWTLDWTSLTLKTGFKGPPRQRIC
jgi:hypothetical protein